jgi:hypothetical protein
MLYWFNLTFMRPKSSKINSLPKLSMGGGTPPYPALSRTFSNSRPIASSTPFRKWMLSGAA